MERVFEWLGVIGAVAMPLFNVPLVLHIRRRGSSDDISLWWVWGVWSCIVLMFPSSLQTTNHVLRAFGLTNLIMFSCVVVVVMAYRKRIPPSSRKVSIRDP